MARREAEGIPIRLFGGFKTLARRKALTRGPVLVTLALALLLLFAESGRTAEKGPPYEVAFEGIAELELQPSMESVSDTVALKDRPPISPTLLRRRAKRDIPGLIRLLRSNGYYGAQVSVTVDGVVEPRLVTFKVTPGDPYLLGTVDIGLTEGGEAVPKLPNAADLGLIPGVRSQAKAIIDARETLVRTLKKQGYPFPKVDEQRVVVDHAAHTVSVRLRLDPGPAANFGPTQFEGLKTVDTEYLRNRLPWRTGDRFDDDLLVEAQKALMDTALFSVVEIQLAEALDEGQLPVTIRLTERKHRSFSASAGYKTDEGPGGKISWEHRNLWGRGERLTVGAAASGIMYALDGAFRKPDFRQRDQSLLANLRVGEDTPDAYTSRNIASSLLVERKLARGLVLGGGVAFRAVEVSQLGETDRFALVSSPWHLNWDTSDHLLDPTRGGRLALKLAPYFDTLGADLGFMKGYTSYSRYLRLLGDPDLVLATRAAMGVVAGASRSAIPADERLYAGGGGSIRGYAFQTVGPLLGDDPVGGRSLLELSMELRLKITRTIGVAAFVDGGNAFGSILPDPAEGLQWGAGAGIRYYTPIGPLRLDVGLPLNRRSGIDDAFQIYVSLGQAF